MYILLIIIRDRIKQSIFTSSNTHRGNNNTCLWNTEIMVLYFVLYFVPNNYFTTEYRTKITAYCVMFNNYGISSIIHAMYITRIKINMLCQIRSQITIAHSFPDYDNFQLTPNSFTIGMQYNTRNGIACRMHNEHSVCRINIHSKDIHKLRFRCY